MRPLASRDVLGKPLRRLRVMRGGACAVLIYHRVADVSDDPQMQCIPVDRFLGHMTVLAREFTPISATALVDHLTSHSPLPRKSVVVTFDDGYADNFAGAYPILQDLGVPATIFVSSGLIGSERLNWVDEVEALVLRSDTLPERLDVPGLTAPMVLGPSTSAPNSGWNVTQPPTDSRQRAYLALVDRMRTLDALGREVVLGALRSQIGELPSADEDRRMLHAEELRTLASGDLVTIGSHTVNHVHLGAASPQERRAEITGDRAALEAIIGRPVDLFSYPYGSRADYNDDTVRVVRSSGFAGAFANHRGVADPWTDRYGIPRISAIDVAPAALADTLREAASGGK